MPKVSVIIPCYNLGLYIDEAVDSILNQTFKDLEIIIINDGSTDNFTNHKLDNYLKDKTIVIKTQNNGVSSARNTGIRNSTGEYIIPLDADDKFERTYIEKAVSILQENSKIGIVYCNAEYFGRKRGVYKLPDFQLTRFLVQNAIFCSAMFRREDYNKTTGYNSNMKFGLEDWDFWLSLLELELEVYKIPQTLFYYRVLDNSRTKSLLNDNKFHEMYKQMFFNHHDFYMDNVDSIIDCVFKMFEIQTNPEALLKFTAKKVFQRLQKSIGFFKSV